MFRVVAKKAFVFIALLAFLIIPLFVLAQGLEIDYPEVGGEKPTTVSFGLPNYVKYIFTFVVGLSGLIALGALIWGGFTYLTSAGNVSKMQEGKEKIFSAFLGITILLGSYILLSTINPQLVLFNIPPLDIIKAPEFKMYPGIEIDKSSLISSELPLSPAMLAGVWEDDQTKKTQDLIISLENFVKKETKIDDDQLFDKNFNRISDINKYLRTVADQCRCENLKTLCTKPQNGSMPIGCVGDPCLLDQDKGETKDSPRAKIKEVLNINRSRIDGFLDLQKQVNSQRSAIKTDIRKYQATEEEILACQSQKGELATLSNYLSQKQSLGESGIQSIKIPGYYEPKQSNLTFYCTAGGTLFDSDYTPSSSIPPTEKVGCPVELNTGEVLDNLKELAITEEIKLNHISLLIESLAKKIQGMESLISYCNDSECKSQCKCIDNPCYNKCVGYCAAICKSRCLQAMGGCSGDTCPLEDIEKNSQEIKKIEDELLFEIENVKVILSEIPGLKITLNNLDVTIGLCSDITTCQSAINNGYYDKNGQLITSCHPRNLFCCTPPDGSQPSSSSTDITPFYIIQTPKISPLKTVNNCPEGWLCDANVQTYNEYKDASDPLKQLLACMRPRLDAIGKSDELENIIGVIGAITDANIYKKTCGWETGAVTPEGCKYAYDVEYGKERVSAHYGGLSCRYDRQSYAVDIDLTGDLQKKYAQEIIETAKDCSPGAYIVDESPYIHIDVAQINQCSASE
jgi:hypothetical protein